MEVGDGVHFAYEMRIDPPGEHPCAQLCRDVLAASGLGTLHCLTSESSQVTWHPFKVPVIHDGNARRWQRFHAHSVPSPRLSLLGAMTKSTKTC
jgi:hypothetical protein